MTPDIFIVRLLDVTLTLLYWVIIIHIVLSWIPSDNPTLVRIKEFVDSIVQPIFALLRKIVPSINLGGAGFDLTPLIALLLIYAIRVFVFRLL